MGYLKLYVQGQTSCTSCTAVIYDNVGIEVKRKTLTKSTSTTNFPLWQTIMLDGDFTVTVTCTSTPTCTNSAPFTIAGNTVTINMTMPCLGGKMAAKSLTSRKAAAGKAKAKATCCCSCCGTKKAKPAAKKVVKLAVKKAPAKKAAKPAAKKAKKA